MTLPPEPEILDARQANSQELLDGATEDPRNPIFLSVGWYDVNLHPDRGWFAVASLDHPELVGDRVRLTYRERSVVTYCFTSADVSPYDLVITRRSFADLTILASDALDVRVETLHR